VGEMARRGANLLFKSSNERFLSEECRARELTLEDSIDQDFERIDVPASTGHQPMLTQILQRLVPKNHKKVEKLKSVLESIENKRASHNLFQNLILRNSQQWQHNTTQKPLSLEKMGRIVADAGVEIIVFRLKSLQ
jgi:hypothetical protein